MPSDTVEFECPDCGGVHDYVIVIGGGHWNVSGAEVVDSYLASFEEGNNG